MDKKSLALLERAFEAEIDSALNDAPRLMQTRSKLAEKMVADGYLERREVSFGNGWSKVTVKGYGLTLLGNLTYCMSVDEMLLPPAG